MPRVGPYPTVISFCAHPYINYCKNNLKRYPHPECFGPRACRTLRRSDIRRTCPGGWSELPPAGRAPAGLAGHGQMGAAAIMSSHTSNSELQLFGRTPPGLRITPLRRFTPVANLSFTPSPVAGRQGRRTAPRRSFLFLRLPAL